MKIRKLLFIPLLCLSFGVSVAVSPRTVTVVKAEEETVEVVPEEQEQSSVEEFKNEVDKFKETVVNPIIIFLGSLNFASIATVVIGVLIRHVSNKKRDKKFDDNNATLDELIVSTTKAISDLNTAKDNANKVFFEAVDLVHKVIDICEDIKQNCGQIVELKQSVIAMAETLTTVYKNNPEAIKNGAAKQLKEVSERIQQLK